jgi:hypothetical protein
MTPHLGLTLGSISVESNLHTFLCLLQQGNIFVVDYELLDGIDANKTDPCTHQFLAAPICLLYKNLANKIGPIAIQVGCPAPALVDSLVLGGGSSGRSFQNSSTAPRRHRQLCLTVLSLNLKEN